jgi:hypothetical protein
MPFEPPEYPATLTKANWDSNKSILAKMKGYTGIGDALHDLEAQYKKVPWKTKFDLPEVFGRNVKKYFQDGITMKDIDNAARAALADGDCAKLRKMAQEVRDLARDTAAEYAKSKTIPKKTTQLCRDISTDADRLAVAVNTNSLSSKLEASKQELLKPLLGTAALIEKNFASHVKALEKVVLTLVQNPTRETWIKEDTMTYCRNLNQQIGNVEKLARFDIDVGMDEAHCVKFFDDMEVYAAKSAPFKEDASPEEIKMHVAALIQLLKRAKAIK